MSSNVNEVIRPILNFLFFFYEKILHAQKAQSHNQAKAQKAWKAQNANKQINNFFPLKCFYAHKNAAFLNFVCLCAFCAFCSYKIFS